MTAGDEAVNLHQQADDAINTIGSRHEVLNNDQIASRDLVL